MRRILNSDGVPPFRQNANELVTCILDPDGSCTRLARIVLKDLGLTSHILRLGNSARYNHSGRPISDVGHAITLLGWQNIRSLVGALKYVEYVAKRSPGLRELMVSSLLSGSHGRETAISLQYPWPEEAYIAGLFRGLGEVLIARHYPREYSHILVTVQDEKMPAPAACVRILGFPWDEVGHRIAQSWNLPPKVVLCLSSRDRGASSALDRCLISIADYSHRLTNALYREGAAMGDVQRCPMLDPSGQSSLISVRDLHRIIGSSLNDAVGTLALLQIPADTLRLEKQARQARDMLESIRVFDPIASRSLDQTIQCCGRVVASGDFELSPFVVSLIDEVHAAGFDRVVFGLVNEDRTRMRGRLGSGDSIDLLLDRFDFPLDPSDGPLGALQHMDDIVVDRELDAQYDQSQFVQALEPTVFLLLPIVIDTEVVGFLYADCVRAVSGLENAHVLCGRVRDVITQAIRRKAPTDRRSGSPLRLML